MRFFRLLGLVCALSSAGTAFAQPAGGDKPADAKPADAKPADAKPADAKPADAKPAPPAEKKSADTGPVDGSTHAVRLRDLEQRINELKEQIRRSHTRLSLLSDTILSGGVGGARAEIRFVNELSTAFRLTRALFVLDGAVQYNKQDDTGTLATQREVPIYSGAITPGDHVLQVLLKLRGHGYGVFSYLRGYHFEVKSSHSFTAAEGKTTQVDAVAWEKGGVTTPLEQRPAIRYSERVRAGTQAGSGSSAPVPGGKQPGVSGGFSVGTGGK